ncbi:alpha/beta fold hydrolase [Devosia sp. 919]|uniref:alpha/beta hydrolase n=1 Tax=Devosia sp. 919 TaxID=2726065 RepID=UPI001556D2AF|nr:alpha/beta fold hydrolase [Devosia sp. 919]
MNVRPSWVEQFPGNFQWSNALLVCKGMAPYGAVSLADLDRVVAELVEAEVTSDNWFTAWKRVGEESQERAQAAEQQGDLVTAGSYFLRAGNYLYTGERFIEPGPEKVIASQQAFQCYHRGIRLRFPQVEFVEVPYGDKTLPALFMPAQNADAKAPCVIVFNGMDNCKEMSILFAGLDLSARGFHTLAVDGPGQGETMRLRNIPARPDYEVPAGAAIDWLSERSEVDADRIAVLGYSFGGYYAARIAAKEPRVAAGIALTAGHWDFAKFQRAAREKAKAEQKAVAQPKFQFQWVVGASNSDEALEIAEQFSVKNVAHEIRCPFLVTHGAQDRVVPVANATRLFDAIPSDTDKTLMIFETNGSSHAHVDDRPAGVAYAADWLSKRFFTSSSKVK